MKWELGHCQCKPSNYQTAQGYGKFDTGSGETLGHFRFGFPTNEKTSAMRSQMAKGL